MENLDEGLNNLKDGAIEGLKDLGEKLKDAGCDVADNIPIINIVSQNSGVC